MHITSSARPVLMQRDLQDNGWQVSGFCGSSASSSLAASIALSDLEARCTEAKQHLEASDLLVCELHSHAAAALRLVAWAGEQKQRSGPLTCVGISSPLTWARTQKRAHVHPAPTSDASSAPDAGNVQPEADTSGAAAAAVPQPGTLDANDPRGALPGSAHAEPAEVQWQGTEIQYRRSAPSAVATKEAEDTLLLRHNPGCLHTYVICPGVLYGQGEWECGLHSLFAAAWQGTAVTALPVLRLGSNKLPMLHVADLANAVLALAKETSEQRYLILTDDTKLTQSEVVRAISKQIGSGQVQSNSSADVLADKVIISTMCQQRCLLNGTACFHWHWHALDSSVPCLLCQLSHVQPFLQL